MTVDHVLQRIVLDAEPDAGRLYGMVVAAEGDISVPHNLRRIPAKATLDLGCYVNAYYAGHWSALADLDDIAFTAKVDGPCRVRVDATDRDGNVTPVGKASARARDGTLRVPARFAAPGVCDSVLTAKIIADDTPVRIEHAAWTTCSEPVNAVRLAVVICSFARVAMLARTIERLAGSVIDRPEILGIWIVHQSDDDPFNNPEFAAATKDYRGGPKLNVVRQANAGGSAGFTRGMIAARAAGATHILLMDDDVRIDPAMIDRVVALAQYAARPTVVGGYMLDIRRPAILHAAHERVRLTTLELDNPLRGHDLATGSLRQFALPERCDYNAWWLCCIPVHAIEKVGYPLPLFLRHDDVEYGLRCGAAGIARMAMPALFVWHEPFDAKVGATYAYYDRRNFLITASIHGQPDWRALATRFGQERRLCLAGGRADYAMALDRAVDDFLAGPEVMFQYLAERHRDIVSTSRAAALAEIVRRRRDSSSGRRVIAKRTLADLRSWLKVALHGTKAARAFRSAARTAATEAHWRRLLDIAS